MSAPKRGRGSAAERRHRQLQITDFVSQAGSRTVEEIAAHAHVSTMTVYRDISELESIGLLRLAKGVVTAAATNLQEAASRYRVTQSVAEKQLLAAAALDLVDPGSAIMLDDSSTGIFLARLLPERAPLTVVTNYLAVVRELEDETEIRLLVSGGEYLVWAEALMGPTAIQTIRQLRADAVFMSVSAIADGVAYHPTEAPAELKRAMLDSSQLKVLYADHTKFERSALHMVAPLSDFDVVIVDAATPQRHLEPLREAGVRVIQAGLEASG